MKAFLTLLIIAGIAFAIYDVRRVREANRRAEERTRQVDAVMWNAINATASQIGSSTAPVGRELSGSQQQQSWNVPSGFSPSADAVTVGPNGEKYYHHERTHYPR
ncbi:MAG: hypothetical protein H0X66_21220 [Verrucomicrobia bacterium]|nr:hypothetical protein [Verrucomicrobiota bacterium]